MPQPVGRVGRLTRQDLVGGRASLAEPQLGADEIGRLLGHQPVGRQLAAHDRHEIVDAIASAMIEHRVGARDGTDIGAPGTAPGAALRLGGTLILVERSNPGICPQQAHARQCGEEPSPLGDELGDLGPTHLVAIRVLDVNLGGAQDRDRVDRDHDVAVARPVAAVDDRVGHALVEDEHRALARRHCQVDPGQARHLPGPGPRRGDHGPERHPVDRPAAHIRDLGRQQTPAGSLEADEPVVRPGLAAPIPCVGQVGFDQLPRLQRPVRHLESTPDRRVERRLPSQEVPHGHFLARHAAGRAGIGERRHVLVGVVRGSHEVAAGVLDAGGCDPAQDAVFVNALAGRQGVLGDVASARMEQAVVATARAAAHVALLDEQAAQAAPSEVAQEPGSGCAAADDEHIDRGELSHRRWARSVRAFRPPRTPRSRAAPRSQRPRRGRRPPARSDAPDPLRLT